MDVTSPELVKELISNDNRLDGRKPLEYRKTDLVVNALKKADGCCMLSMGDTKVIVGIKFDVITPYPDSPNEGGLMVSLNYVPITFKTLPQNKDVEISRVVDRSIRESKMLNMEDFCITPKEKAFSVFIDAYVINYDGNLMDALNLAAIKALMNTKMPVLTEDGKVGRGDKPIPLRNIPVMVTVSCIDQKYVIDLNSVEEQAIDYALTISYLDKDRICAMQKQGEAGIPKEELEKIFEIGSEKQEELRNILMK
ncbi:MAG: exosome complex protein Rrp42 [Candidatus Aenigmarchaeota archaeon]|nr:exosome complex protein Rrp42 [Candidatus Aenigmarchaeota archaeon]